MTTDITHLWPLVVTLEDVFVPHSAAILIDALRGLDDEACAVTVQLWAMDAEGKNCWN